MQLAGILRIQTFRNKRGVLIASNDIFETKQELMCRGFIYEEVEIFKRDHLTDEQTDSLLDSLLLLHMDVDRMNALEAMQLADKMYEDDLVESATS